MTQHAHSPARRDLEHLAAAVRDGPVEAPAAWTGLADRWTDVEALLRGRALVDEEHLAAVRAGFAGMLEAPSDERRHALFLLVTALGESVPPGSPG